MFNITNTIAALADAETVIQSKILTDDEKGILLDTIIAAIDISSFGTINNYVTITRTAIHRYRHEETGKAIRSNKQPEVAEGGIKEGEAPEAGTPTGSKEQAEDPSRLPQRGSSSTSKSPAKTRKA